MRHRNTYMYINFQQNRVSRSVITAHKNLFANNRKLHKFATTNSNFFKFDSLKHVYQNSFAKKCKLQKFATCN